MRSIEEDIPGFGNFIDALANAISPSEEGLAELARANKNWEEKYGKKDENLISLIKKTRQHAAEAMRSARKNMKTGKDCIKNGLSDDSFFHKCGQDLNKYCSCKSILRMLESMRQR